MGRSARQDALVRGVAVPRSSVSQPNEPALLVALVQESYCWTFAPSAVLRLVTSSPFPLWTFDAVGALYRFLF